MVRTISSANFSVSVCGSWPRSMGRKPVFTSISHRVKTWITRSNVWLPCRRATKGGSVPSLLNLSQLSFSMKTPSRPARHLADVRRDARCFSRHALARSPRRYRCTPKPPPILLEPAVFDQRVIDVGATSLVRSAPRIGGPRTPSRRRVF